MTFKPNYFIWPILLTVITFFSLGLVVSKTINFTFYLLVLISLLTLLFQRSAFADFWLICKRYWPIILAMFGILIAITINQMAFVDGRSNLYDYPSRIAAFVLLFWLFLQIPAQQLTFTKWGWIIGVILCTIKLCLMDKGSDGRPDLSVWFIELVMLLCVLSLVSIGWNNPNNKRLFITQVGIQIIAGVCGLYAAYLSQTRGIWIAIPFFLFLAFVTYIKQWYRRSNIVIFISCIAILSIVLSNTAVVNKRFNDVQEDIRLFSTKENIDTSIGTRFQLWHASWLLFKEHPFVGVGQQNYSQEMQKLVERKIIIKQATRFDHSHNEILYKMMTQGLVGLFGILLIYLVPAYYFVKELGHGDHEIKASALMGLCVCVGYMIFGLVDVMLNYKAPINFYSIALALFLAHIVNRKKMLGRSNSLCN